MLLILFALSNGCQRNYVPSPWATRATIPTGSTVQLLQPLTVPPNDNQVFIPNRQVDYSKGLTYGYDLYYPFCFFELHGLSKDPRTIEPDIFTIQRVYRDETEFVQSKPVQVASLGHVAGSAADGGGIRLIVMTTVMDLHSEKQPMVRRLVCGGGFELESFAEPPTMKEVSEALQGVVILRTISNIQ